MFRNDYSEAAAKEVLTALLNAAEEQNAGYGLDAHSEHAQELILSAFGLKREEASVYFLGGGTQTNMTVISYYLRPYEAVIACDTGHINVHETGAVEGSGHKVLICLNEDGKLRAKDIETLLLTHRDEHVVKPRMVYISDSTETGTVYTKSELSEIRRVCDENDLLLFIDGARLGAALTCEGADVDAKFIGKIADVFYVGGTKNGALFGEAVVMKTDPFRAFRHHIKNRGAMLAKGYVNGIQFETLFTDDLYFRLAGHSNEMAAIIRHGLSECGISPIGNSKTNQIFIRTDAALADRLIEKFGTELWEDEGAYKTVRIVTSFATREEDCKELIDFLH